MLYNNLVIIIVGIILILISLYFIVKQGKLEEEDYYYKASLSNINNDSRDQKQDLISDQLILVSEELEELKNQLEELRSQQRPTVAEEATSNDNEDSGNFTHALNYQLFIKRNNDIINLYNEGHSIEEISKKLNKSFREVEMIIKLIK